jgi:hypothetical protein
MDLVITASFEKKQTAKVTRNKEKTKKSIYSYIRQLQKPKKKVEKIYSPLLHLKKTTLKEKEKEKK